MRPVGSASKRWLLAAIYLGVFASAFVINHQVMTDPLVRLLGIVGLFLFTAHILLWACQLGGLLDVLGKGLKLFGNALSGILGITVGRSDRSSHPPNPNGVISRKQLNYALSVGGTALLVIVPVGIVWAASGTGIAMFAGVALAFLGLIVALVLLTGWWVARRSPSET